MKLSFVRLGQKSREQVKSALEKAISNGAEAIVIKSCRLEVHSDVKSYIKKFGLDYDGEFVEQWYAILVPKCSKIDVKTLPEHEEVRRLIDDIENDRRNELEKRGQLYIL